MQNTLAPTQRGSVMVEFALVAPLLVMLFLGVVFYGYDFYTYNRLEETVRGGARFASRLSYLMNGGDPELVCSSGTTCTVDLDGTGAASQFALQTKNYVVFGTPTPGTEDAPVIEGLTIDNVKVYLEVTSNRPQYVWVSIDGYSLQTPFGKITLNGKPKTGFQFDLLNHFTFVEPT